MQYVYVEMNKEYLTLPISRGEELSKRVKNRRGTRTNKNNDEDKDSEFMGQKR